MVIDLRCMKLVIVLIGIRKLVPGLCIDGTRLVEVL